MNLDRLVSSRGARIATLSVALFAATALVLHELNALPQFGRLLPIVSAGCGLLTFAGLIVSFRPLYLLWSRIADVIQTVMMSLLFGCCYLLVVPFFVLIVRASDPLHLRGRTEEDGSFWTRRRKDDSDVQSFQRMV